MLGVDNPFKSMKRNDRITRLLKSKDSYLPLQVRLFYALYYVGWHDTDRGFDYFTPLIESVIDTNRCFVRLFEMGEPKTALPLLRMQVDNLLYIYAETLYPNKVLRYIFVNDYSLDKVEVDGKCLKRKDLFARLDADYANNGIKNIYDKYCGYIHPSKAQSEFSIARYYKPETEEYLPTKKSIIPYERELHLIDNTIKNILKSFIASLEQMIRNNGKYREYNKTVKEELGSIKQHTNN